MDAWPASEGEALHTSTTLGNPLGCAMALASIGEHLKEDTPASRPKCGSKLKDALLALRRRVSGTCAVSGRWLGVELVKRDGEPYNSLAAAIMRQGLQDGLILLGGGLNGNVLSFAPPFRFLARRSSSSAAKLRNLSRPLARLHFVVEREPLRNIRLDDLFDELHVVGILLVERELLP